MNPRVSTLRRAALFVLLELLYIGSVRMLLLHFHGGLIPMEGCWTLLRLLSILALVLFFKDTIWRTGDRRQFPPALIPAVAAFLCIPVLVGNTHIPMPANIVMAVTGLAVGFREELAYRGVLQRLLTDRTGPAAALLISNILFVFYHLAIYSGIQPITPWSIIMWSAAGLTLGLLYCLTRSLVFVALLHAAIDAIACLPSLPPPSPEWIRLLLFAALIAFLIPPSLRAARSPGN